MVDNKKMMSDTTTLTYASKLHALSDMEQIYIHQLAQLCEFFLKDGRSIKDVDLQLIKFFETDDSLIPIQAFELLFGIYRHKPAGIYDFENLLS